MARSEVADGGAVSNMEGSYEYIERAVADIEKGCSSSLGVG